MLDGYWGGSWIHNYGSKKIKDLILAYKHNSQNFEKYIYNWPQNDQFIIGSFMKIMLSLRYLK
jgi:hypothetical protein